jgi:hypothetical protein
MHRRVIRRTCQPLNVSNGAAMLGGAPKQTTVLLLHLECCSGYVYLKARKHQIRVSASLELICYEPMAITNVL